MCEVNVVMRGVKATRTGTSVGLHLDGRLPLGQPANHQCLQMCRNIQFGHLRPKNYLGFPVHDVNVVMQGVGDLRASLFV